MSLYLYVTNMSTNRNPKFKSVELGDQIEFGMLLMVSKDLTVKYFWYLVYKICIQDSYTRFVYKICQSNTFDTLYTRYIKGVCKSDIYQNAHLQMATSISRPSLTEFATSNKLLQSLESQWFYKLAKLSKNEKWPLLAGGNIDVKIFLKKLSLQIFSLLWISLSKIFEISKT